MNKHALRRWFAFMFVFVGTSLMSAQTNVLTWHNDVARDGLNSTETTLNQSDVNANHFGKKCSAVLDGQVFGQPLVVSTSGKNVVYVVTMNDSVYAVDGGTCSVIKHVSLLQPNEEAVSCKYIGGGQCKTIKPLVGILSTPVIDIATNTIYVVTETESTAGSCPSTHANSCFVHRLHGLDLTTLADKFNGPAVIGGTFNNLTFVSKTHIQRPGLLLLPGAEANGDNAVYVAFSEMDGAGTPGVSIPHGVVFSYDAQNLATVPNVWNTTPTGEGGGIWQSGAGLASGIDSPGGQTYIYFLTGDGTFNANTGGLNYGDSFVKLTTALSTVPGGYFTPFSQKCLNPNDEDFGSGGVLLLPNTGSNYYALGAGKDGIIYVMDRANPGGFKAPTNSKCPATGTNKDQEYFQSTTHEIYATPVLWNQNLFYVAMNTPITRYTVNNTCSPAPVCTTGTAKTSVTFQYGPQLSVSSSGTTTGTAVLWAVKGNGWPAASNPATVGLYAFDAEHVNAGTIPELWDTTKCPTRDRPGNATKFTVPTVANGLVYLGTMDPTDSTNTRGRLDVFGTTTATCN